MSGRQVGATAAGGLAAGGVALLCYARWVGRVARRLRRRGVRMAAVVVDHVYLDSDGSPTPYPLVRFELPDGQPVTVATSSGPLIPDIGARVEVLVDLARPVRAQLGDPAPGLARSTVPLVLGVGLLAAAAVVAAAAAAR